MQLIKPRSRPAVEAGWGVKRWVQNDVRCVEFVRVEVGRRWLVGLRPEVFLASNRAEVDLAGLEFF